MPDYRYRAIDRSGHNTDGTMAAPNELALESQLRRVGYWLVDAKPEKDRQSQAIGKVSRRDLVDFFHGMSALLGAGLPIDESLRAMADEIENDTLRHIIEDIEVHVQTGNEISSALRHYPQVFSEEVCNIVHAGEHGGNLPRSFVELAHHTEWVEQIIGDIKQASIYPAMVVSAVGGLIVLLFVFVIPRFATIFDSLDMQLPLLTRIIMKLGDTAAEYWWLLALAIGSLVSALTLGPRYSPTLRRALDNIKLKMPVLGPVNRLLVQSQLTHNLSLLLRSGVPILDSLHLCRGLVGNVIMQDAVQAAEVAVREGRKASEALREHNVVSSLTLRMFVLGEETGTLEDSLQHVTKRFDDEIPRRVKRVFSILEPVITILLVTIVGFVAAALFLPMFNLVAGLSS